MKTLKCILCAAMLLAASHLYAKTEKVTIQGSVGNLSAVVQTPELLVEGQKCPVVIIMHGFMGNKEGMLEKLTADKLASAKSTFTSMTSCRDNYTCSFKGTKHSFIAICLNYRFISTVNNCDVEFLCFIFHFLTGRENLKTDIFSFDFEFWKL